MSQRPGRLAMYTPAEVIEGQARRSLLSQQKRPCHLVSRYVHPYLSLALAQTIIVLSYREPIIELNRLPHHVLRSGSAARQREPWRLARVHPDCAKGHSCCFLQQPLEHQFPFWRFDVPDLLAAICNFPLRSQLINTDKDKDEDNEDHENDNILCQHDSFWPSSARLCFLSG